MKIRKIIISIILAVFVFLLIKPLTNIYIDYLWFEKLNYADVFKTIILSKVLISVVSFAGIFAVLYLNLFAAKKFGSNTQRILPDELFGFEGMDIVYKRFHKLAPWIIAFLAYIFSGEFSNIWHNILAFFNKTPFNQTDPVFNKDISYYVFTLPILKFVINWVKGISIFSFILTCTSYILSGNIQFSRTEKLWVNSRTKVHLMSVAAFIFIVQGLYFLLEKYILLLMPAKHFTGADYITAHIHIPFLNVLFVLSVVAAIVCLVKGFSESKNFWVMPAGAVVLIFVLYGFGTKIVSKVADKFIVQPNELRLETPYIANAIEATRKALGLDKIKEKHFPAGDALTMADLASNRATIDNIRLWDQKPLIATYSQLQEIRTYYSLADADNDRYTIDGKYRQIMLSARELNSQKLPSLIWINERIIYTHGYGITASSVAGFTPQGLPEFIVKNIPPVSLYKELELTRPNIYFGELASNYVITNTKLKALDYPFGDKNVYANYEGTGGIKIKNILRKAIFALYFKSFKILLSSDITAESKILMNRNIHKRVRKISPFLAYDSDPYPVIANGRTYWIIDGYTHSGNYPYSEKFTQNINYIRNSVKVVIDAYEGTTNFYVADTQDPVLKTYSNFLPALFKPLSEIPKELKSHLRYPKEMFMLQAKAYLKYHMKEVKVFYNQEDLWTFPTQLYDESQIVMEPYYTIMKLNDSPKEEYILMLPFTPVKKDNMIAWLAARSDEPHRGELIVYRFPKEKLVYGPMQIEARINQDGEISEQFTLWGQKGTRVIRGSLMVIPIENALLYVEPVYLQAKIGKIPELRKVIAVFGEKIAMEDSLDEALQAVVKASRRVAVKTKKEPRRKISTSKKAHRIFTDAQKYLRRGNWVEYGRAMDELGNILKELAGGQN